MHCGLFFLFGIPDATVAIGKAGAKNAALLAVQILSLMDSEMKNKLGSFREEMAREVELADAGIG